MFSVPLAAVGGLLGLRLMNLYRDPFLNRLHRATDGYADDARVHHSGRHGGEQRDPDRAPVAQPHRDEGMAPREAIRESVRTRIRPIFMSMTTSVLGMSPLVLFPGRGIGVVPRHRQRRDRRAGRLDGIHAVARADAVQPGAGRADAHPGRYRSDSRRCDVCETDTYRLARDARRRDRRRAAGALLAALLGLAAAPAGRGHDAGTNGLAGLVTAEGTLC